MLYVASEYFLWFLAYSVAGWIWEVILFAFTDKKFINRGFLFGPFCPIYGAGGILMWLTLNWTSNIFILFFLGGLIACTMEFIISYVMEKLFHARWWDYSRNRFNIQGRVCLLGFTAFACFTVLVVKWIQPGMIWVTEQIPRDVIIGLGIGLGALFALDFTLTICRLCKVHQKLARRIQEGKASPVLRGIGRILPLHKVVMDEDGFPRDPSIVVKFPQKEETETKEPAAK